MSIREIAFDLTVFTLSNVNDAISFKPQLCFEVPKQDYQSLKENYINFTGTSIRKNRSKLFFLPTNVSDELQKLNPSIPEDAKRVPSDGRVYYKNRLITELDYENVKRVETACAFIAYTALNSFVHFETELPHSEFPHEDDDEDLSPSDSVSRALRKGNIVGFRELGHLVGITPWHFHRVFKVITGLTIREYGQLCVEFIKKNKELVNTCRLRVEDMKNKQRYSCLDDENFLQDGNIQYAATENVVLLHEYFIDPNKSKEFKIKKGGNANANANANAHLSAQPMVKSESQNDYQSGTQRSEIRKRRSSVMYGRMQRASQSSITSNSSLYDCLSSSRTDLRQYLSHDEDHNSDNETDDSNGSVLEPPTMNFFSPVTAARSVSPPINSRKGSIISIGSAGGVTKRSGKRKSVTDINLDALANHRRNRSDGCTMNLSFEPLQPGSSLDARLSPSPNQYPIEFNSNVFNTKPQSRVPQFAAGPVDYDLTNDSIMADVSLFNNSLLEQTTPPAPLPDQYQSGGKTDPSMDDITNLLDINNTNSYLTDVTALTPVSQNKGKEFIPEMPFNPISNEDDELLFESALAAADCLVVSEANLLPQSTSAQTSTDTSTALNISNFGELNF
ncbi:uncharacterized protein TDEL_0B06300 [Torulaspora delbrueckii]|uniref:Uncharacterized protein n=1 Tax=Torulaspora delbrueckii TaxID=4950 RepID=G8ZQ65_TORDE|nr:hypothetical protein TDEL_0B06300 [Torulaspora delbrueckii]CCE90759.1 hypothetical protein TDEL_0B06300 [Torulaspora delbrueckii]